MVHCTSPNCINGQSIEGFLQFVFLGSVVYGCTKLDAIRRTNSARSAFVVLSKIVNCSYLIANIKLKVFGVDVFIMLLYGFFG